MKSLLVLLPIHLFSALNYKEKRIFIGLQKNKQINLQDPTDPLQGVLCTINSLDKETPAYLSQNSLTFSKRQLTAF